MNNDEAIEKLAEIIKVLDDGEPEYHHEGMGCGLEDRNITDRYEAMEYGWEAAMERIYSEVINYAKDKLAAIQADPMAYGIKPKPLVWAGPEDEARTQLRWRKARAFGGEYYIERRKDLGWLWWSPTNKGDGIGGDLTIKDAQAAAWYDYCAKFAEMIGEPQ